MFGRVRRDTQLYDPIIRLIIPESTFKNDLIKQTKITGGQRVLDLGCGTATLTIFIKETYPEASVIGLDGDSKILEIARAKVTSTGLDITLDQGMAFELPYNDNYFDRIVTSLVIVFPSIKSPHLNCKINKCMIKWQNFIVQLPFLGSC